MDWGWRTLGLGQKIFGAKGLGRDIAREQHGEKGGGALAGEAKAARGKRSSTGAGEAKAERAHLQEKRAAAAIDALDPPSMLIETGDFSPVVFLAFPPASLRA
jgi:hypothetical protein